MCALIQISTDGHLANVLKYHHCKSSIVFAKNAIVVFTEPKMDLDKLVCLVDSALTAL